MSEVAMDAKPTSWHTAFFSPRSSPSLAPAQPQPDVRSPSSHSPLPGGPSLTGSASDQSNPNRSDPALVSEPLFLGVSGGGRGVPKGISVVPLPSGSEILPPPDIAPSSPQSALVSPALPSPAPEELSEGYDADEDGDEGTEDGRDDAEEDVSMKGSVSRKGDGWQAEAGAGAVRSEAEPGAERAAEQGAEGGGASEVANGGDTMGTEDGSAGVGAGRGGLDEAADTAATAVRLEAAPGVGGGDSAEVVASTPLGHPRCGNVDEAEVAAISLLLLMALAEAVVEKRKGDMFPRPLEVLAESARKELCTFLDAHGTGRGVGNGKSPADRSQGGTPSGTPESAASSAPFALPAPSLALASSQPGNQPGDGSMLKPGEGANHSVGKGAGESKEGGAVRTSATAEIPSSDTSDGSSSTAAVVRPNGGVVGSAELLTGSQDVQVLGGAGANSGGGIPSAVVEQLNKSNVEAVVRQTLASSPPKPQSPTGVEWKEGEWVPPALQVAPQVEKLLEEFVASQLTLLTRLSSAFGATNRAAVEGAAGEIEAGKLWQGELRRDLARVLIQRMDVKHQGHCGREFVCEQNLRAHEPSCPYKAVKCGHAPCTVSLSQKHMGAHQELCPHRLIPCRQGCAEAVPRGVMASHCGTTCPMRVLTCPFAALSGRACGQPPLLQKDLAAHLEKEAQSHQLLMLHAMVANQEFAQSLAQRLSLLEKAQELQDKALGLEVRGVQVKLTEVGTRVDKVIGRVDKVEKGLARGTQDWRQQQGVLKREAAALKQQVQGLLKK